GCLTECTTSADCVTGLECQAGACVTPRSSGGAGGSAGATSGGSAGVGAGGSGGSNPSGGTGGSNASGGTGQADAGPDGGTKKADGGDEGGCGCRTVGASQPGLPNSSGALAGLLLLGGFWIRRRRAGSGRAA